MLYNPYQRFTKEELTQQGFKLAFIDNNFLSYLTEIIGKVDVKSQILNTFKSNKIKPVLNSFVFYEFIKGISSDLLDSR